MTDICCKECKNSICPDCMSPWTKEWQLIRKRLLLSNGWECPRSEYKIYIYSHEGLEGDEFSQWFTERYGLHPCWRKDLAQQYEKVETHQRPQKLCECY